MRCEATTAKGERCKAPPVQGDTKCFHHSDRTAAERQKARRLGGLRLHHGANGPAEREEVGLGEVRDVLGLLEVAAADILSRKAGIQRARALVYLSTAALKCLEASDLEERVTALEARLQLREAS